MLVSEDAVTRQATRPRNTRAHSRLTSTGDSEAATGDEGWSSSEWLRKLNASAGERIQQRLAPASRRKLRTAMRHFRDLERRLKGTRTLLETPRRAGDPKSLLHNEWSLVLFAEYLAPRRSGPKRKRLAVDTVAEYVSMVKTELSVTHGFAIAGDPQRLPSLIKAMRRERPVANRRQRRGIRRSHLRRAWRNDAALRKDTPEAANAWAAAATAWQVPRG